MIEEFTEEVKLAGGIGCFEKGMPLHSSSSISQDQKEIDFLWKYMSIRSRVIQERKVCTYETKDITLLKLR